jgi:hypothetical protein
LLGTPVILSNTVNIISDEKFDTGKTEGRGKLPELCALLGNLAASSYKCHPSKIHNTVSDSDDLVGSAILSSNSNVMNADEITFETRDNVPVLNEVSPWRLIEKMRIYLENGTVCFVLT